MSVRALCVSIAVTAAVCGLAITARSVDPWDGRPDPFVVQPAVPPFDQTEVEEAREGSVPDSARPTVEAAFESESYRPGSAASVLFFNSGDRMTLRFFLVGAGVGKWGNGLLEPNDVMRGTPVGSELALARVRRGERIHLRIGNWPSGLYYLEITAPGGRVGYAPFVLAPKRLGEHPIGVVLPTQTWQAYNYRDDNRDGVGDTWYAGQGQTTARLYRPFANRGVPTHYKYYDEPFLRWLAYHDIEVDVLSDAELNVATASALRHAYNVLIFPGHHEYVTQQEYDAVRDYRDLGGSLIFLSANNFYSKITVRSDVMTRVGWYRYLGTPESALIGVQFYANDLGEHRGNWTVRRSKAGRWIFRGTGLVPGDELVTGGIEADEVSTASPRNVQVLAEIPNLFGDGRSAQMTYYETAKGAKVFAAGAFTLACSVWQPPVRRMMANLITALSGE